jgi:prenyltransferase beta subunit
MSLRLEMLQVARLAPSVLGTETCELIASFVGSQQNDDGGFQDRDANSDLYYTCFAIDTLTALQIPLPEAALHHYLIEQSRQLNELDFVHRCCLMRSLSALEQKPETALVDAGLAAIDEFRTDDGGYNQSPNQKTGSAYGCFLAYGAWTDHHRLPPDTDGMANCLETLADANGGWTNDTVFPIANVPATAAAISLCRNLRRPIPEATANWILSAYHPTSGGFLPFPGAPMPDLLSTAVALHALDGLQKDFSPIKESCLDYIDTLWTADGGFHGNWDDNTLDLEYTYYGLLALGHLAL